MTVTRDTLYLFLNLWQSCMLLSTAWFNRVHPYFPTLVIHHSHLAWILNPRLSSL